MVGVPETTDRDLQYLVLPDDPLAPLPVLEVDRSARQDPECHRGALNECGVHGHAVRQQFTSRQHFAR
jgi:hypothetical protein